MGFCRLARFPGRRRPDIANCEDSAAICGNGEEKRVVHLFQCGQNDEVVSLLSLQSCFLVDFVYRLRYVLGKLL